MKRIAYAPLPDNVEALQDHCILPIAIDRARPVLAITMSPTTRLITAWVVHDDDSTVAKSHAKPHAIGHPRYRGLPELALREITRDLYGSGPHPSDREGLEAILAAKVKAYNTRARFRSAN